MIPRPIILNRIYRHKEGGFFTAKAFVYDVTNGARCILYESENGDLYTRTVNNFVAVFSPYEAEAKS